MKVFTYFATVSAVAILFFSGYSKETRDEKRHDFTNKVQRQVSPPERSGPLGGFANIVRDASPSVVSISTSGKVASRSFEEYPFLFEDPFFRRFFGDPRGIPDQDRSTRPRPPQQRKQGLGSGVILTADGYIVTNHHVIDGADQIEIQLAGKKATYDAEVIGKDPSTDLALLKIDAKNLPAIMLGDSALLQPGDTVIAIGNPFGLSQTVTSGIVSAVGRKNLSITDYSDFIQTDASINPGNSGGALIDNRGRLVGINTAIFSRSGGNVGIGFAIPSNMAMDVLTRLATDGEVHRGYLGVMLSDLTKELADGFGVDPKGVLVNDVMENTPASKAGFEPGDIILNYQEKPVSDMADLRLRVANTKPGTNAKFDIIRSRKERTITAEIGQLPTDSSAASNGQWGSSGKSDRFLDGVDVTDLDQRVRSYYRIPDEVEGILVTRVEVDSAAAESGLREGDVITTVGGEKVKTVADANKALNNHKGTSIILRVINSKGSRFLAVELGKNSN